MPSYRDLADLDFPAAIDHSLLAPKATLEQVDQWCEEADRFHFASVCVHPCHVKRAVQHLHGRKIGIGTVIGFPLGTQAPETKLFEAQLAVDQGATELDVRINLSLLQARQFDPLHVEIARIVEETGVPIKAILETTLLTDEEKTLAAEICVDAGVEFLKTSTGWFGGATVADVRQLYALTEGRIKIKAAGGIRTLDQAVDLLQAGATRLGTSYGVALIQAWKSGSPVEE